MYKTRFKTWGLTKNLVASHLPSIIQEMATMERNEDRTDLVIRGQRVALKKVEYYLKRRDHFTLDRKRKLAAQEQKSQMIDPHSLAPIRRIDPSDDLRLPEVIIKISHQYVAGGYEGIWARNATTAKFSASAEVIDWLDKLNAVTNGLNEGRHEKAFAILHTCFDRFKLLLIDPTPSLFLQLYTALVWLPFDVGLRLLRYAAEMAKIMLPANHPLTLAWTELNRAGIKKVMEHAWLILGSHLQILGEWFHDSDMEMIDLNHTVYNTLSPSAVEATELWQRTIVKQVGWVEILQRCRLCLMWVLYRSKNYDQVSDIPKATSIRLKRLSLLSNPGTPLVTSSMSDN
jgi:hypothetical protein